METNAFTRRGFLGRLGVGAAAVAVPGSARAARSRIVASSPQTFGRIFSKLPPFAPATDAVRATLLALGAKGGPLDAKDQLAVRSGRSREAQDRLVRSLRGPAEGR